MKFLLILSLLVFAGCDHRPVWDLRHVPTTEAERSAVAANVEKVLAGTPRTLSGHDQDWDDAIKMAYVQSRETLCRPTMWERAYNGSYYQDTGRWHYAEEVAVKP